MMEIDSQNPKPENNADHFVEKNAGCPYGNKAAGFAMDFINDVSNQTDIRSNADIGANAGGSANTYAYVRVSAKDQNEARQLAAISTLGIPRKRIYVDKQSGKDFERPAYKRLMGKLKPGDLLVIGSIDRLGCNYKEILEQWNMITKEKGVRFGRKEAELPDDFEEWYLRWRRKEITGKKLSDHLGVHITTVYHRARKLGFGSHSRCGKTKLRICKV